MFYLSDTSIKAILPFFYKFAEPDLAVSQIRTRVDVNWVVFFPISQKNADLANVCMVEMLKYMTGVEVVAVKENAQKTVYTYYHGRD